MAYNFADAAAFPYRAGALFLGLDPATGQEVGISTERHAITIAGSRSGKGAALIVPNLRRWPHNVMTIDPKGENAALSWQEREALGQPVYVLDGFKVADVPERLRATFNPLGNIDPAGWTGREELLVIADGMVKIHDSRHTDWAEAARAIIAGLAAYVVETATPDAKNLVSVRDLLNMPDDQLLEETARMLECTGCGGLARAGGLIIQKAIQSAKGLEKDALGQAARATSWLDSPALASVMASSSFDLADLKTGKASVYLVLPPQYIETYSTFLRLFVRCGINAMANGPKGEKCLFLLDEFFALGKIEEIAKSAGLMAGYGVHLWPILQDLGQLQELYDDKGAETFFANADAHIFFGNTDGLTLLYQSRKIGNLTAFEASNAAAFEQGFGKHWEGKISADEAKRRDALREQYGREMREFRRAERRAGDPRLTPEEIAALTGKGDGDAVARSMIVFAPRGAILNLQLAPYFVEKHVPRGRPNDFSDPVYRAKHIEIRQDAERKHKARTFARRAKIAGLGALFVLGGAAAVAGPHMGLQWWQIVAALCLVGLVGGAVAAKAGI